MPVQEGLSIASDLATQNDPLPNLSGSVRRRQHITVAVNGLKVPRMTRVGLDLGTESRNEMIDGSGYWYLANPEIVRRSRLRVTTLFRWIHNRRSTSNSR